MTQAGKIVSLAPDHAKAFGIMLVVFGHVLFGLTSAGLIDEGDTFWSSVYRLIYLFHMPLFFFLSGLFFEQTFRKLGMKKLLVHAFMTLLVPMAVWSYVQLSLQYFASAHANNKIELHDVIFAPFPPQQQFWFLASLFLVMAVSAIIFLKNNGFWPLVMLMICSFGLNFLFWQDFIDLIGLDAWKQVLVRALLNFPYFIMGMVVVRVAFRNIRMNNVLCLLLFAAALAAYQYIPEPVNLVHGITSIACVLCVYKFMLNIEEGGHAKGRLSDIAAFVGMNSMIIYLSHVIFAAGTRTALLKMGIDNGAVHLAAGNIAGLILPLMLVPAGIWWAKRTPKLAHAVLPVRVSR